MNQQYLLNPIGFIKADETQGKFEIHILPEYRDALEKMDQFSHTTVIWWADKHDNPSDRGVLTADLPYAPGVNAGVFACRSEYRPNPVAISTVAVLAVDMQNGIVTLPWIDAFDGTPVLDLKPYIPVSDRIRDFRVAEWLQDWPEWQEDAAEYFAKFETDFGD